MQEHQDSLQLRTSRDGRGDSAASLQFVRKISGFNKPSKANEAAFDRAIEQVAQAAHALIDSLVTTADPRDREVELQRAEPGLQLDSAAPGSSVPRYSRAPCVTSSSRSPGRSPILAALTLGLAPFRPPHLVEKLEMLFKGTLVRPIDWFDLALHGAPWLLVILKGAFALKR